MVLITKFFDIFTPREGIVMRRGSQMVEGQTLPTPLMVIGLVWFLLGAATAVLGLRSFMVIWWWSYAGVFTAIILFELAKHMFAFAWARSKKATVKEMYEAIFVHEFHKMSHFKDWTPYEFQYSLWFWRNRRTTGDWLTYIRKKMRK